VQELGQFTFSSVYGEKLKIARGIAMFCQARYFILLQRTI